MLVGLCIGLPASAGNSAGATGSTSCTALNIMETTNSTFTYYRSSLETAMYNAVAWNVTNNVSPTDLVAVAHSSNTTSTDAVYNDGDYSTFCGFTWHPGGGGSSVIGLAKCNNLVGSACDRHYVYFDTSAVNAADFTLTKERRLACHETGHVFGITHTTGTTCMSSNIVTNYSTHEINDIINWIW